MQTDAPIIGPTTEEPAAHSQSAASDIRERERSAWSFGTKVRRVLWMLLGGILFRWSFHNWYAWRRLVLRMFGATVGPRVRVRPSARIEMPWNVEFGEAAIVGDHAILYALGHITLGPFCVISQYAHLCAGTHDHTRRSFPLVTMPIAIGREVWVAADAFVGPGVTVGDRSIVGARASVFSDVPPDMIVSGNPARVISQRMIVD
jgi:putative colanic acid biosynthesis acetyltransferase WcaF